MPQQDRSKRGVGTRQARASRCRGALGGPGPAQLLGKDGSSPCASLGWLRMSCFAQLRPMQGPGSLSSERPRCHLCFAPRWDTARDEHGWGSRWSLPAAGGDPQPWQEQVVDAPTAPSADLRTRALCPRRRSPPALAAAAQRSHSLQATLPSKPRKAFSASCAAGIWASDPLHRITECFGLEGTFKGHLVQPPAVSRDIFNPIRLLRAPSSPTRNVSRDGAWFPMRGMEQK